MYSFYCETVQTNSGENRNLPKTKQKNSFLKIIKRVLSV